MRPRVFFSVSVRFLVLFGALFVLGNLLVVPKLYSLPAITNNNNNHHDLLAPFIVNNVSPASCRVLQTVDDIRRCYPDHRMRTLPDGCPTISTWDDLQRCVTGSFIVPPTLQPNNFTYTIIHVIGERNSGTKWLVKEMQQCFPRHLFRVKARRDFVRSKHFFQPILSTRDFSHSIVVSLFRNPVEWVAAMREAPYHSPNHLKGFSINNTRGGGGGESNVIPMEWDTFVQKTWATKRTQFDLQLIRQNRIHETTIMNGSDVCYQGFALDEVVPCRFNATTDNNINNNNNNASSLLLYHQIPPERLRGYEPVYELRRDHTGRPFANILQLRRDKIVNFALEIPLFMQIGGFAAVRYEDLLLHGTRDILEKVARMVGMDELPTTCKPTRAQPDRLVGRRVIPNDFRAYVEEHVDAATERLLGYKN